MQHAGYVDIEAPSRVAYTLVYIPRYYLYSYVNEIQDRLL